MTETLEPGKSIKPNVSENLAKTLIEQHYGYNVIMVKELNSYDDNNFYVEASKTSSTDSVEKFIFKVLNSMDSKKTGYIEAQNEVMTILNKSGIRCPLPVPNVQGAQFTLASVPSTKNAESTTHIVRLLTFLEGKIMYEVPTSKKLLIAAGDYIGNIENLLRNYTHPALKEHRSVWLLEELLQLRNFLYVLKDDEPKVNMVEEVLGAFEKNVVPQYTHLRKGFLHGDFNEQNIIVKKGSEDYELHGIIDFGDSHISYYIFELAITLCYMMLECMRTGTVDPFVGCAYVVQGYVCKREVSDLEFSLLRTLIAARLCQSLVLGAYTHTQDPGNQYVLTTKKRGWALLEKIWRHTTDEELTNALKPRL